MSIVTQETPVVNTKKYNPSRNGGIPLQKSKGVLSPERIERRQKLNGFIQVAITRRTDPRQVVTLDFKGGGMTATRTNLAPGTPPESRRGVVTGFSKKSRRRLREKLIAIDWTGLLPAVGRSDRSAFVTLTYPGTHSGDWQDWKRDLQAFQKRLKRRYGVTAAIWRLEYQRRGSPHYHVLIIFDHRIDVKAFRKWVSQAWYDCVGSGDPRHLKAGTNCRMLYGPVRRLLHYLCKYLVKQDDQEREGGRAWGTWGTFPESGSMRVCLDWRGWVEFCRRIRKWGKKSRYLRTRSANCRGFLIFGDLRQLLRGLDDHMLGGNYVAAA